MRRLAAALLALALPLAGAAQVPDGTTGRTATIAGEVVDAVSGQPLSGATVRITVNRAHALSSPGVAVAFAPPRSGHTDSAGAYRFGGLTPALYVLSVRRVGYRPVSIEVDLRGRAASRVSIGLDVIPVRLVPVEVRSASTAVAYGRRPMPEDVEGQARVSAARLRQREYVGADVREVTHADVLEAVTLAETDLFRAFQRLPGVATRDEYSAELWVRGSRWDHTRVYFDGLPLFNPLHAAGGISGIDPDAVGAALLHPGVRPASLGEGAAAVVDVRSRPGDGDGDIRGVGELSLVSARIALDQRSADARSAWMVAARRSYLDWITALIARAAHEPSVVVPYSFGGVTTRVDRVLSDTRSVEASAIIERDRVTGDIPDFRHGNRAMWGNVGGRVSLLTRAGPFALRHTVGATRFVTDISVVDLDSEIAQDFTAETEPPMRASISHLILSGVADATGQGGRGFTLGYEGIDERAGYDGATSQVVAGSLSDSSYRRTQTLRYLSGWLQWRGVLAHRVEIESGVRVDAGSFVRGAGAVRPSPRLTLRWSPDSSTNVSVAAGRSMQYAQTTWRPDRLVQAQLLPIRLWLLADRTVPALRSDILTIGGEHWVDGKTLLTVGAFARRMAGVTLPDPAPGPLIDRPLFVIGTERARGAEVGIRRMSGRWTGALSYSLADAAMRAAGWEFASPTLRRHTVDATARLHATSRLAIGAAFTAASGTAYTRIDDGASDGDSQAPRWLRPPHADAPGGQRGDTFRSLDLTAEWMFGVRGARLAAFAQLQNALGRSHDASLYTGYDPCATGSESNGPGPSTCVGRDTFAPGIPRLPVVGLRAVF